MYAHQVIEDLKNKPQITSTSATDFIIKKIKQAQQFHVGDWQGFVDFLPDKSFEIMATIESETIRMPYHQTYIDGETKDLYYGSIFSGKFAFLFEHVNTTLIVAYSIYFKQSWSDLPTKAWMLWPTAYVFSIGKRFCDQDAESLYAINIHNKDKSFLKGDCCEIELPIDLSRYSGMTKKFLDTVLVPGIRETSSQALRDVAKTICTFCSFLSCKNISTIDNHPPGKLNKKRIENGKQPLFTYKTLVIKPTSKKQTSQESQGIWENRVHLCRGHFKTYTDKNPLFGSQTGRYWWQPAVRGNKEKGIVMKDYEVRPK